MGVGEKMIRTNINDNKEEEKKVRSQFHNENLNN